jgi:hypothetical protein
MLMRLFKNHWIGLIIILVEHEQTLISIKRYKQEGKYFVNTYLHKWGRSLKVWLYSSLNYLNEAIAYLVVRSRSCVTLKPITDFSLTFGKYSGAIASKNPPVNNSVICDESKHERLFVSSRSMTHHWKFTGGNFVGWVSR